MIILYLYIHRHEPVTGNEGYEACGYLNSNGSCDEYTCKEVSCSHTTDKSLDPRLVHYRQLRTV